jgi:spore germination cell wall hydrolase CwlJ-like protein
VDRSAGEGQSSQPDREEIQPFEKREIKQSAGSGVEAAVKMSESGAPGRSEALPSEAAQAVPSEPVKTIQPEQVKTAQLESAKTAQSEPAKADSGYASDLDLLARLITAEAQGEPYEAKVAVGAVVMNRVQSGSWPDTIQDVIYQKINGYDQFTPVANGWINKPAQAESIKAAAAALKGADPTGGAEFYYDDSTTNSWILGKPVSVQIGSMIYAF